MKGRRVGLRRNLTAIFLPIRAWWERSRAPGYGCCKRCRRPWLNVKPHGTDFCACRPQNIHFHLCPEPTPIFIAGDYCQGCFPLCETCWQSLTPTTRLPYYRQLFDLWVKLDPKQTTAEREHLWQTIEQAVLDGR